MSKILMAVLSLFYATLSFAQAPTEIPPEIKAEMRKSGCQEMSQHVSLIGNVSTRVELNAQNSASCWVVAIYARRNPNFDFRVITPLDYDVEVEIKESTLHTCRTRRQIKAERVIRTWEYWNFATTRKPRPDWLIATISLDRRKEIARTYKWMEVGLLAVVD